MKTHKSVPAEPNRRLLLMVPLIFSMALASCTDVAVAPGRAQAINLQSAVVGKPEASDNVTIGPRNYNLETRGFDRPWPFGPESDAQ
jgi:hypothetical protein